MEPFQSPPPSVEVGPSVVEVGPSVGVPQAVTWPKYTEVPVELQNWKWVLFSTLGRLERKRYIIASLSIFAGMIAMWMVWGLMFLLFGGVREGNGDDVIIIFLALLIPLILLSLLTLWPNAVMAMKRLRDMDQEPALAFLYIFAVFIPWIGGLIQFGMWIWMMVQEGTRGPNQYGPTSALFQQGLDQMQGMAAVQTATEIGQYSK